MLQMPNLRARRDRHKYGVLFIAQRMKFSIKDFFSKCVQIRRKLRIWSHLLEKSLMENFIFYAVLIEFVREDLICKILKEYEPNCAECTYSRFTISKKWLCFGICRPPPTEIFKHSLKK